MTYQNDSNSEKNEELNLGKIFYSLLEKWPWFLISTAICLVLSYSYIWYTQPVYEMTATVLASEEGTDISQNLLEGVGMLGKKRNIENEIAILSSRSLIEKAIGTLDLNVTYTADFGLRTRELYLNSPLKLDYVLSESAPSSFLFNVSLSDIDSSATITYELTSRSGVITEFEQQIILGEQFTNSIGQFRLQKTEYFNLVATGDSAKTFDYKLNYRSIDQLATVYMQLLSVSEAREKASILRLTLEDKIGQRGVDVLNAILSVFIQDNIEKKNQLASNSLKFIDNQLETITNDLVTLESDIKEYKASSGISDVSAEAIYYLDQIGTLDKSVSGIDVKLSIIGNLENYIVSNQDLKNASPASLGIDDPLFQKLIGKLSELSAERESMLKFTKTDNPLVAAIDSQIAETKVAITNNIGSIRSVLNASKKEVNKQLSLVDRKVKTLPKAEYELLALQRQYSIKESTYILLLQKKSENAILLASTVSDNMIIDKPRSSEEPIKPTGKLIYLAGLVLGLGLPAIYTMVVMAFDNRIKDVESLKQSTSIPLLGIIPHNLIEEYLVVKNSANSAIAESFRSARTNLSFLIRPDDLAPGVSPKVIQLTSAMGSEGKSFCSINLSASLALGGHRTVVVGLDLRKPKLAQYFDIKNDVGASSVLAGINSLDEAIVKTRIENLDVLVAGPIPPNPSELLMDRLAKMLINLETNYDYIVLDTPPIGLVTDSLIISEHSATTIYVTRQGVTRADSMIYINDLYTSGKIKSVSVLFNDVKVSKFGYGYGYGYGYGNGYYGETKNQSALEKLKGLFG